MPLCKWHSFWKALWLTSCFIVALFYTEKMWLLLRNHRNIKMYFYISMEKLTHSLTLEVQIFWNFSISMLLMEVSKCWKTVQFPRISVKMKNFKTFPEAQTASRLKEIIQSPNRWKLPKSIEQNFLTEIYRNIKTFNFQLLWGCCSWTSRNSTVAMFFLRKLDNQKHVCWKICEVSKNFCCVVGV